MGRRRPNVTEQVEAAEIGRLAIAREQAQAEAERAEETRNMPEDCYSLHSLWFRESWRSQHGAEISLNLMYQCFGAILKLAHQAAHLDVVQRDYYLSFIPRAREIYDRTRLQASEFVRLCNEVYRPDLEKRVPDVRSPEQQILDAVGRWTDEQLDRYEAYARDVVRAERLRRSLKPGPEKP